MCKYTHQIQNFSIQSTKEGVDAKNINHILCLEYFFASPADISIENILVNTWLIAYEHLINYANKFVKNHSNKKSNICLKDWFAIKSKNDWLDIISANKISKKDASTIFSAWILNSSSKKNKGDIFDHPFYIVDKNKYLLFSSLVSQLAPIQCLLSLAKLRDEKILTKSNHFENEVQAGLERKKIKFIRNLNIEKEDGVINKGSRIGEFDFIFEVENTLFFVECKRFLQPFYFKNYQIAYEKIHRGCKKLKKNINHIISNQYRFNINDAVITEFLPENWWEKKKIEKILLTSCSLGEYLFLHDCHVFDIEVFNAWLFNKEISLRDTQTMKIVQVIYPKKRGSLLERFEELKTEISLIEYKKSQCTMKKKSANIGSLEIHSLFYWQKKPDIFFVKA